MSTTHRQQSNPTKSNHINPCFWTALWNEDYFNDFMNNRKPRKRSREQAVYLLDLKIPKIIQQKTENIHTVEALGIAIVSGEELLNIRNLYAEDDIHPPASPNFDKSKVNVDATYLLDIENDFSTLEEIAGYQHLLKTIKTGKIETEEDRIYLSCFITFHQMRSQLYFEKLISKYQDLKNPKLNAFIHFKESITSKSKIYNHVNSFASCRWTMHVMENFTFPLTDHPILYHKEIVWIVLSPKHLLELDMSKPFPGKIKYKSDFSTEKFQMLKKVLIFNTYQSIIFGKKELLEKWAKSSLWARRRKYLGYK